MIRDSHETRDPLALACRDDGVRQVEAAVDAFMQRLSAARLEDTLTEVDDEDWRNDGAEGEWPSDWRSSQGRHC